MISCDPLIQHSTLTRNSCHLESMDRSLSSLIKRIPINIIPLSLLFLAPVLSYGNIRRPAIVLEDVIPPEYDSIQTPDIDGQPADVSIQIIILNIRSVDVSEMSYIADIFLYETWRDPRLRYPADKKLERISLHPEWRNHLWTPDVYFYNAIEGKVLNTVIPYVNLWLKNDSTVIFGARLSLEFSCDMLLHKFPHDTQTCDIIVKSLTHTLSEMNLHWNEKDAITVGDCIILPQFELLTPDRSTCNESNEIEKHGETFACLRGIIQLTRRSGYYIINIYIPTVLIVFMSMLTFWIPVDAVPGRVTLGVTSLLTIITKQYQASLPSVSYVVALNVWLSVCIGFVFCGLLEYSAVVALLSHQKRLGSDPIAGSSKDAGSRTRHYLINMLYSRLEKIQVHKIDRMCRVVFPVIFCIHCIIYFSIYM
uniref:Putative histamine-activated chloride channel n=1 Tax=Cupiennius salei TaxID=6928 RepID=A0A061QLK7_CUPSA